MEKKEYIPRIIDSTISRKLMGKGAILIEGPKWVGKTTTAAHFSKSIIRIDDPLTMEANLKNAELNPYSILAGETPRLIDEWQFTPELWDTIRHEIDDRGKTGQFILTGSTTPADTSKIMHSGVGRFAWIRMRPMSLYESGESCGDVSLSDLFESDKINKGISKLNDLNDVSFVTCRGGWPQSIGLEKKIALDQAFDYVDATIKYEVSKTNEPALDSSIVKKLMRSYARNQGTQAPYSTITKDIISTEETANKYLGSLKRTFVIEDANAWNPNLRSKTAIRTSPTRYFVDPSIATASLGLDPDGLMRDLNTFGFIFETLCIRDLRVYAESLMGEVYHYRDASNLECDAVIVLRDGRYGLVEIKLGGDSGKKEAVDTLNKFSKRIDIEKMNEPSFKAIITANDKYAYKITDDINVIPIGCLKN